MQVMQNTHVYNNTINSDKQKDIQLDISKYFNALELNDLFESLKEANSRTNSPIFILDKSLTLIIKTQMEDIEEITKNLNIDTNNDLKTLQVYQKFLFCIQGLYRKHNMRLNIKFKGILYIPILLHMNHEDIEINVEDVNGIITPSNINHTEHIEVCKPMGHKNSQSIEVNKSDIQYNIIRQIKQYDHESVLKMLSQYKTKLLDKELNLGEIISFISENYQKYIIELSSDEHKSNWSVGFKVKFNNDNNNMEFLDEEQITVLMEDLTIDFNEGEIQEIISAEDLHGWLVTKEVQEYIKNENKIFENEINALVAADINFHEDLRTEEYKLNLQFGDIESVEHVSENEDNDLELLNILNEPIFNDSNKETDQESTDESSNSSNNDSFTNLEDLSFSDLKDDSDLSFSDLKEDDSDLSFSDLTDSFKQPNETEEDDFFECISEEEYNSSNNDQKLQIQENDEIKTINHLDNQSIISKTINTIKSWFNW